MIHIDLGQFEKTLGMIEHAGDKTPQMMMGLVKKAGRKAQTPWRKAVVKATGLKSRDVQRATKTKNYAQGSDFLFEMRVRAKWTYLTAFDPVQTDEGIEASPWGQRQIFKGAFFGTVNKQNGSPHFAILARKGEDRLPIKQLYGPNIAVEGVKEGPSETFQNTVGDELDANLQQQIAQLFA
ncbi:MAG: hypothetical protein OIF56_15040 [Cohaesibacter sp.]|nr:hypothetical protein [Cohaesibacter sp.]